MPPASLPDLTRRLLDERGAFTHTAELLRDRLAVRARNLTPRRVLLRHPDATLSVAAASALLAGLIVGRLTAAIFR